MNDAERGWRLAARVAIRVRISGDPDLRRIQRRTRPPLPWTAWACGIFCGVLVITVMVNAVSRPGNEALAPLLLLLMAQACGVFVGASYAARSAAYALLPLEAEQVWRREWSREWRWAVGTLFVFNVIVLMPLFVRHEGWTSMLAGVIAIIGQTAIAFAVGLLLRACMSAAVMFWFWLATFFVIVLAFNADPERPIRSFLVPWLDDVMAVTPQGVFHDAVMDIAAGKWAALPVAGGVLVITVLVLPGLRALVRRRYLAEYTEAMMTDCLVDVDEEQTMREAIRAESSVGHRPAGVPPAVVAAWSTVADRDPRQELATAGWIGSVVAKSLPSSSVSALAVLAPDATGWTRRWQWSVLSLGALWLCIIVHAPIQARIACTVITLCLAAPWLGGFWQGWERLAFPGVIPIAGLHPVALSRQMRVFCHVGAIRIVIGLPVVGGVVVAFFAHQPLHAVGLTAIILVVAIAIQPVFFALTISQRGNGTVFTNMRGFLLSLVYVVLGTPLIIAVILSIILAIRASWVESLIAIVAVLVLVPVNVGWWWRGYHQGAFDLVPYPR